MTAQRTERMRLIPATATTVRAEAENLSRLGQLIGATVPQDWPPEILRDARESFLKAFQDHPDWAGWLHWYGIRTDTPEPTLCGSVGFMGPPDADGTVEVGYSVLPAYQRGGLATEMVAGILSWALAQAGTKRVEAETTPDNVGSVLVLERNGFARVGPGREPGSVRYRLDVDLPPNSPPHPPASSLRSGRRG